MQNSTSKSPFCTTPTAPFTPGTLYEQFANQSYTDSSRSRWEAHNVDIIRKAAALRNDIAAMERTLARMEAEADAADYTTADAEREAAIRDLIAKLPADEQLAELITLKDSLDLHQQVAADCHEAHLEMLRARLEIIVKDGR